jgi:hypothetical protein
MENPVSTERRPLSEWHRGAPERRLAGVCSTPTKLAEPSGLDRVIVAFEDLFGTRSEGPKQER